MEGLSEKSERKQTGAIVDFFIMSFLIILLDKKKCPADNENYLSN